MRYIFVWSSLQDSPWKRKKRRMRCQRGRWDLFDEQMLEIPSDDSIGRAHVMSEVGGLKFY